MVKENTIENITAMEVATVATPSIDLIRAMQKFRCVLLTGGWH
jgi:hypothetical protein